MFKMFNVQCLFLSRPYRQKLLIVPDVNESAHLIRTFLLVVKERGEIRLRRSTEDVDTPVLESAVFVPLRSHGQTVVVVDCDLLPSTDSSHGHQSHHQPKSDRNIFLFYPSMIRPCQVTTSGGPACPTWCWD